ncbi:MAG: hypothetical protein KDA44_01390 [Planctomycetales bacterium]|nr:hypothetical protein [Planctomycetales bacterium]
MNPRMLFSLGPIFPTFAILGFALNGVTMAEDKSPAAADAQAAEAPVRRVVLFNSGVGYFERQGVVTGDATIDLVFNVDDVNDLLKSMVVQDADGGRVSTVTYGSRDPITRTLATFAIDLNDEPSLGELLQQIRGEQISLEAPMPIEGAIVGIETQRRQLEGNQTIETELLTLLTDKGLRRVPLDSIGSIQLARPELDAELRQALRTLALGHATDKKTVSLRFTGEGERRVSVGYILEAPVWKTSYRLVLDDEGKPFLQGWAIVENTTDADWSDVQLSLVSGRPISFAMDLYSPLFASRPVVTPELYASLAPQVYDLDLFAVDPSPAMNAPAESEVLGRRVSSPSAIRGGGGGAGGFGGGGGGGYGGVAADMPAAMAPASPASREQMELSVTAAAQGGDVGELFQYDIDGPVTLARQRSAMLPIVNQAIAGQKVSIYNPAVHSKHPLNGVQLQNTSDLHLMQGPVTVFDGGVYAGDARIPDLPAGGERLLSYAMDLDVEVAPQSDAQVQSLTTARIGGGALILTYKQVRSQKYALKNSGDDDKTVLVEYPHDPSQSDWELVTPEKPTEQTRDAYRFAVAAVAGERTDLQIKEQRTIRQSVALRSLNDRQVAVFVEAPEISDAVRAALRDVQKRQAEIAQLTTRRKQIEREIATIGQEQTRIRDNMRAIDRNTDLYNRYVKKFTEQEDRIEKLRNESAELEQRTTALQTALEQYIAGLELDGE